jgi:hypothetical protein
LKLAFHPSHERTHHFPTPVQTEPKRTENPSYMRRMKQLSREKKAALEAAADE